MLHELEHNLAGICWHPYDALDSDDRRADHCGHGCSCNDHEKQNAHHDLEGLFVHRDNDNYDEKGDDGHESQHDDDYDSDDDYDDDDDDDTRQPRAIEFDCHKRDIAVKEQSKLFQTALPSLSLWG